MDTERRVIDELSQTVIGAVHEVSNVLGAGFLEKVYERALARELPLRGLQVVAQAPIPVFYKGEQGGEYLADLLVEGKLIIELKCVEQFADEHLAQCLNYLMATGFTLALLVNFQRPKAEWRKVFRNH